MRVHTIPWLGVLGLLVGCAASERGGPVTVMEPAYAAKAALAPRVPGPAQEVDLELAFPLDGTIFSETSDAYVAGRLDAPFGVPGRVDAVIVIDTSHSTARSADPGQDDPVLRRLRGRRETREPEASILQAELDSARLLLGNIDPRATRLGIVHFAGRAPDLWPPGGGRNAHTEVPLTRARDELAAGLQRIARRGSADYTDMASGLDQAVDELVGRGLSRPDRHALKVVVFFTDGTPTLPHPRPDDNELAVIRAAERAAAHGIRVFSFAVGPEALGRPVATVEMARRTGGVFTPVRHPKDLTVAVESVRFANLDELEIRNLTLGAGARRIHLGRDGTFDALVPLQSGKNRIHIRAVVGNATAEAERFVHYAPGSARPFVPAELELRRAQLLRSPERELEVHIDPRLAAIERERHAAERRAARQLKELRIDVASPPPDWAQPDERAP